MVTDILSGYSFFREAPDHLREEMIELAGSAALLDVGTTFTQADCCGELLLLGSGCIRVFLSEQKGRETTLYRLYRGRACPINMSCLLHGEFSPVTIVVEEAVRKVSLPGAAFRDWVSNYECVRRFTFETMSWSLDGMVRHLGQATFQKLDERLASFLLAQLSVDAEGRGYVRSTHEKIALEIGTVREVVSRLLRDFERKGAVSLGRGRVALANRSMLEELAS